METYLGIGVTEHTKSLSPQGRGIDRADRAQPLMTKLVIAPLRNAILGKLKRQQAFLGLLLRYVDVDS